MNKIILSAALLLVVMACSRDRKAEVELSMKNYDRHLLHMDADSISLCFLSNGVLTGEGQRVITGSDSIREFLKSFKGASILSTQSFTKGIDFKGDTAHHHGNYKQVARLDNGDTLALTGDFDATWVLIESGDWRLKRMYTSHYTNKKLNK